MQNREELAGAAGSREIIHLFLRRGEFGKSFHVDHDHCQRVQALSLVDRKEREVARLSFVDSNKAAIFGCL